MSYREKRSFDAYSNSIIDMVVVIVGSTRITGFGYILVGVFSLITIGLAFTGAGIDFTTGVGSILGLKIGYLGFCGFVGVGFCSGPGSGLGGVYSCFQILISYFSLSFITFHSSGQDTQPSLVGLEST